jgi:hypothetical protein
MSDFQLDERVQEYARRHGLKFNLKQQLGAGTDGNVWATSRRSVIKVFGRQRTYLTELRCYQRLTSKQIREIDGLTIPRLLDYADDLWIFEISLVHPPYPIAFRSPGVHAWGRRICRAVTGALAPEGARAEAGFAASAPRHECLGYGKKRGRHSP